MTKSNGTVFQGSIQHIIYGPKNDEEESMIFFLNYSKVGDKMPNTSSLRYKIAVRLYKHKKDKNRVAFKKNLQGVSRIN